MKVTYDFTGNNEKEIEENERFLHYMSKIEEYYNGGKINNSHLENIVSEAEMRSIPSKNPYEGFMVSDIDDLKYDLSEYEGLGQNS